MGIIPIPTTNVAAIHSFRIIPRFPIMFRPAPIRLNSFQTVDNRMEQGNSSA